jgi:hypothetical protein
MTPFVWRNVSDKRMPLFTSEVCGTTRSFGNGVGHRLRIAGPPSWLDPLGGFARPAGASVVETLAPKMETIGHVRTFSTYFSENAAVCGMGGYVRFPNRDRSCPACPDMRRRGRYVRFVAFVAFAAFVHPASRKSDISVKCDKT